MKILITGINGFVGQYLSRELESRKVDVWGIDIESYSNKVKKVNLLDKSRCDDVLKNISPDYIIHLAAIANVDNTNISLIYDVNFQGTLNLLSSCQMLSSKPRFLYVSSSQVYGNVYESSLPVNELFLLNPVNHYGASKVSAEMAVRVFGSEYGMEYVITRPFNHTGPGQSDKFVVPKIVNAFKKKRKKIDLGNIDTIRDYTDVRDVVKAYCNIIDNFKNGAIYNIASGTGVSINEIFIKLGKITGYSMEITRKDYLLRKNEIMSIIGNPDKIKNDLNWDQEISLENTLRSMLSS